jgi:3-hydroxyacyl-[acyl-carrier-protein] dehydratase
MSDPAYAEAPANRSRAEMDVQRIMEMIPHRHPFLMIDKVVDAVANERATGIKNVSINEQYFQGHFPTRPVMPGVLIVEAMAQTAAVLVVHTLGPESEGKLVYFMSVDNARFRRPVFPGDCLHVHVSKQRNRGNVWKFEGRAEVRGQLAAEAVFAAMILDD